MKKGTKIQFCPRGHDTFILGRSNDNHCLECKRNWSKKNLPKRQEQNSKDALCHREGNWKRVGMLNEYNLPFTRIDFDRAYQIQQGRCGVCGKHQSEQKHALVADHSHKTGRFRGLVCRYPCNTVLIKAAEDFSELLTATRQYLRGK